MKKEAANSKAATPLPATSAKAKKAPLPSDIKPMLATLTDQAVDGPGWMYELKWDGYRAIAYINKGKAEIRSRNNKSFNEKYYPVTEALNNWKINAVLDGEIIVMNDKGEADFSDLQTWRSEADGRLAYYIFDILWLEGKDLMSLPLSERRNILERIVPDQGLIKLSKQYNASGADLFAVTARLGLEGIMAKRADSAYTPDLRTKDWLKIKTEKRGELVIGGYTRNENTSKQFSALLLGLYTGTEFRFVTPVGTGFNYKVQSEILHKLQPLIIKECPFSEVPEYNKPSRFRPNPPKAEVTWVKPELVVEISFREQTKGGAIRHPSFKGLREDKNAREVVMEQVVPLSEITGDDNLLTDNKLISSPGSKERKTFLNPKDEAQVRNIGGHDLKFTNLGKIYFPKQNISKRDVLNYYYQVVPYMLPYMKDRPQSLNRHPHGIEGQSFYQKDVTGKVPGWLAKFPYHSDKDERDKNFLVCTDEASLLYIASLGCIEMNPWHSRKESPDNPDWCIIDLDPDKNTFEQVIEAANVTREVLSSIGVPAYCKTSGSTGLHIYIPFGAKYSFEDSKEFGRVIAKLVHAQIPDFTTIERQIADREGKMYIDFLQNRPQATVAAAYSLRPKPFAPVSMPLHWDEVKKGLRIESFTISNAIPRLKEQGDIFNEVLGKGIDLETALKRAESLIS